MLHPRPTVHGIDSKPKTHRLPQDGGGVHCDDAVQPMLLFTGPVFPKPFFLLEM